MLEARPCLTHTASTPASVRHRHSGCVLIPLACLAPIGCLAPALALLTLTKVPHVVLSHLSLVRLFVTLWTVACGSSVRGILQARILEWVILSFSRGYS